MSAAFEAKVIFQAPQLTSSPMRARDTYTRPRATIALDVCSKALAWLNNKDFVSPDDIRSVAHDVLRHRIILSFEAEANGISSDQVIDELLRVVPSA